jgi:hypothetical protein
MRIEQVPLILGALVALAAFGFLVDAWLPEQRSWRRERRRRERAERDRVDEALIALGLGAIAAALIGRDLWRYDTVAVLVGTLLIALGAALNWRYLRELFLFRGPARRGEKRQAPRPAAPPVRTPTPMAQAAPPVERERPIQTARLADTGERPVDGDSAGGDPRMRIR